MLLNILVNNLNLRYVQKEIKMTNITPTPEQVEWAECEIGVIIHFDLQVFEQFRFRK